MEAFYPQLLANSVFSRCDVPDKKYGELSEAQPLQDPSRENLGGEPG